MPIIEVENLSKSFGGLMAVSEVSFTVDKGMIFGLIGPNGSGKTTLFNLITGFLKPNKGKIKFQGKDITGLAPYHISRAGIARTFQINKPFSSLTALENVMLGRLHGNDPARNLKQARIESEELLKLTSLDKKRLAISGSLGIVDRKRLEVARALATKPKMLFLDEMMAGLNLREIEDVMQLLRELRNSGMTLVVVEHIMKALLGISDHVMVLSSGRKLVEGPPHEIVNNKLVIEAYLGEEHSAGSQ